MSDIAAKLWNYCHTLRHEGIDYSDYIEELTYLLFLKIASERSIAIPEGCTWNDLLKQKAEKLLQKYTSVLTRLSKQKGNILGDIFKHPIAKIRNVASLRKLLLLIDEVKWSSYNEDVLGAVFESLLEKAANEGKKGAGQYFTPRPLIESIVNVMKPDPFESKNFKLADIGCGTAGFLISSFEWWKKNNSEKKLSIIQKRKLYQKTYFGQELVLRPRRMAQMNLYLHGIEPNIILGDTIYDSLRKDRYSCILTNPPFGSKGANQIPNRTDFIIKTSNKQLNFVQHIFSALENNGRAAIILPDNVLFEEKAADLWKSLMKQCNVHTILRLPNGTFSPYTQGIKANVFFFQKGIPTKHIWIFDGRTNLEIVTKKDRPLDKHYFTEFEECYGKDPNGQSRRIDQASKGRFRKFDISLIEKTNYRLDITWLKDDVNKNSYSKVKSEDLLKQAIDETENIIKNVKKVLMELG